VSSPCGKRTEDRTNRVVGGGFAGITFRLAVVTPFGVRGWKLKPNMKAERARVGLTVAQVAEALGVHANAVSRWENGTAEPTGTHIVKLAALYGCSPDYLLGYATERHGKAVPRP
jgi:DNA-binding XRE family transcriptional regulator